MEPQCGLDLRTRPSDCIGVSSCTSPAQVLPRSAPLSPLRAHSFLSTIRHSLSTIQFRLGVSFFCVGSVHLSFVISLCGSKLLLKHFYASPFSSVAPRSAHQCLSLGTSSPAPLTLRRNTSQTPRTSRASWRVRGTGTASRSGRPPDRHPPRGGGGSAAGALLFRWAHLQRRRRTPHLQETKSPLLKSKLHTQKGGPHLQRRSPHLQRKRTKPHLPRTRRARRRAAPRCE